MGATQALSHPSASKVFLLNYASGSMKSLKLEPHLIYGYNGIEEAFAGTVKFIDFDASRTAFHIQHVDGGFVLMPKGTKDLGRNACLMNADPLTLAPCSLSDSDRIIWIIQEGRIVSKAEQSRCIVHETGMSVLFACFS